MGTNSNSEERCQHRNRRTSAIGANAASAVADKTITTAAGSRVVETVLKKGANAVGKQVGKKVGKGAVELLMPVDDDEEAGKGKRDSD